MNNIILKIKKDWEIIVGVLTAFVITMLNIVAVVLLTPYYGLIKATILVMVTLIPLSFIWTMILFIQWAISQWIDRKNAKRRQRNRCSNCGVPYNTTKIF